MKSIIAQLQFDIKFNTTEALIAKLLFMFFLPIAKNSNFLLKIDFFSKKPISSQNEFHLILTSSLGVRACFVQKRNISISNFWKYLYYLKKWTFLKIFRKNSTFSIDFQLNSIEMLLFSKYFQNVSSFFSRKKSTINFLQDEKVFFVLVLFNDLVYTSTIQKIRLEHPQCLQSNPSSVERCERQLCFFWAKNLDIPWFPCLSLVELFMYSKRRVYGILLFVRAFVRKYKVVLR